MKVDFKNLEGVKSFFKMIVLPGQMLDQDFLILIVGEEGKGKTDLELWIIDIIDSLKGTVTGISHVSLSLKSFLCAWSNSKKYDLLALDEGKELENLNYSNSDVKQFSQTMTKVRKEGHIYLICVTNPIKALRYLREDKVFAVFYVYDRKHVRVFSRHKFFRFLFKVKEIRSLHLLRMADYTFSDTYSKYDGRLRNEYDKLKDEVIKKEKDELRASQMDDVVGIRWAMKRLDCHQDYIYKLMDDGKVRYRVTVQGIRKPFKDDIIAWRTNAHVRHTPIRKEVV